MAQVYQAATANAPTTHYNLDLNRCDIVTEDLLIRAGIRAIARPLPREAERLAAIAARLEREAGR
jgi:hypothetical protein